VAQRARPGWEMEARQAVGRGLPEAAHPAPSLFVKGGRLCRREGAGMSGRRRRWHIGDFVVAWRPAQAPRSEREVCLPAELAIGWLDEWLASGEHELHAIYAEAGGASLGAPHEPPSSTHEIRRRLSTRCATAGWRCSRGPGCACDAPAAGGAAAGTRALARALAVRAALRRQSDGVADRRGSAEDPPAERRRGAPGDER
jgi:hypothetical protein